jgi:DNA-binding MarR family transcriptional regulator
MIQQTSLEGYKHIIESHKLGKLQEQVLEVIKNNPNITDKEISEITKIAINVVTPRRGELEKKYMIQKSGEKIQSNNRKANTWIII